MPSGYLLDTNHIHAVISLQPKVKARIDVLPRDTQILACAITLGEVESGWLMTKNTHPQRRSVDALLVNQRFLPKAIPVTSSTRIYYAKIIGAIWALFTPAPGQDTERYLVTQHGVDINDIWIASVAWEHGLTLVTEDKMECIRKAAPALKFDCWK
jgi:tRNA(fMet)-specific endonuclease VapC